MVNCFTARCQSRSPINLSASGYNFAPPPPVPSQRYNKRPVFQKRHCQQHHPSVAVEMAQQVSSHTACFDAAKIRRTQTIRCNKSQPDGQKHVSERFNQPYLLHRESRTPQVRQQRRDCRSQGLVISSTGGTVSSYLQRNDFVQRSRIPSN